MRERLIRERLILDGSVVGDLQIPRRAVMVQNFSGDVITKRISGKGYCGGHNTAARLGWSIRYPDVPPGAIAWWDDSEEGRWTGYDPAIVVVLPFRAEEVAAKFVADLSKHTGWYSRPDHVENFAARLATCVANGIQFTPDQILGIRGASFSIIGPNADAAIAAWQRACARIT